MEPKTLSWKYLMEPYSGNSECNPNPFLEIVNGTQTPFMEIVNETQNPFLEVVNVTFSWK